MLLDTYKYDRDAEKLIIANTAAPKLHVEHVVSKEECKKLQINSDFEKNLFRACSKCNCGKLNHKTFLQKIDIIAPGNSEWPKIVAERVIMGLMESRHNDLAVKFQLDLNKKYKWWGNSNV